MPGPQEWGAARLAQRILSRADIERLIAHRDPFLFVTRARENVPGASIIGLVEESSAPPFPPSHMVLLEALGQAGALVIRQVGPLLRRARCKLCAQLPGAFLTAPIIPLLRAAEQNPVYVGETYPAFAGMNDVLWRPWPEGGSRGLVEVEVKLVRARRRFGVVHTSAKVPGCCDAVCEAELVFSFIDT